MGFPINVFTKTATLHDGGNRLHSTTTLPTIGKAVVGVVKNPEMKNQVFRVSEADITIRELLDIAKEVVGPHGWTVTEPDVEEEAVKALTKIQQGIINRETVMPFVYKAGWGVHNGGHFKVNDNELLGIKQLDRAGIKRVIEGLVNFLN